MNYKAIIKYTGYGIRTPNGFFSREYELRLFGGKMQAQKHHPKHSPFILKKVICGNPSFYGPKWLQRLEKEINDLRTNDPQELLSLLNAYPTEPEGQKVKMGIRKPTMEILVSENYGKPLPKKKYITTKNTDKNQPAFQSPKPLFFK